MLEKIYRKFCDENMVGKFIYINVAIYIIVAFIGVFATLFKLENPANSLLEWLELPASLGTFITRPWTLFTYMFIHGRFMHILWNMLALYGFGRIFLSFFSVRHFVGVYLLGGVVGGLFFMLAFNLFPYFDGMQGGSLLVGASAAVLAVVVASATRSPGYRVSLFLFGSIRLATVAVITVVVSLLMLAGENAGGNFAHLGGAFAGWLFAYLLNKGVDVTTVINKAIDWVATLFRRRPGSGKAKFKFHRSERSQDYEYNARKRSDEAEIDRILEKVKAGGYSSLTDEEKKRLFDASGK